MTDPHTYFEYLQRRSRLGDIYRRRWLYPRLARLLDGRVLDVGCGIGDMLAFRPQTIGVDINEETVAYCRERGFEAVCMAPEELPFPGRSFDSVMLDNVLEHIEAPGRLLAEIRRVLKDHGRLVVGVPGTRGWQADPDHKVFYDEARLVTVVGEAGFSAVKLFYTPLVQSRWLDRKLRQYCIYAAFDALPT